MGNEQDALKDFIQAIKLNDAMSEAYRGRGMIYSALGNYEAALDDLNQAIRLNPADGQAFLARGDIHYAMSNHERALGDYNEAIRLMPDDASALHNRGLPSTRSATCRKPSTITTGRSRSTRGLAPPFHRGNAHYELGQLNPALADFDMAIEIDENDTGAYHNRE